LMDWLLQIDDEILINKIIALKYVLDNQVVGHSIKGYPIDRQEYVNLVKEADERVDSGDFTTIEDLEKEIENW